jgi:hypothetical protein
MFKWDVLHFLYLETCYPNGERIKYKHPVFKTRESLDSYYIDNNISDQKSDSDLVRMIILPIIQKMVHHWKHFYN